MSGPATSAAPLAPPPGGVVDFAKYGTDLPVYDYGAYDAVCEPKGYHRMEVRSTEWNAPEFVTKDGMYAKYLITVRDHAQQIDHQIEAIVNTACRRDVLYQACLLIDGCAELLSTRDLAQVQLRADMSIIKLVFRKNDYKAPAVVYPRPTVFQRNLRPSIPAKLPLLKEVPEKRFSAAVVKRAQEAVVTIMKLTAGDLEPAELLWRAPSAGDAKDDSKRKAITPRCNHCLSALKVPVQCCSRCQAARYCGRDCQIADWKNHESQCIKRTPMMNAAGQQVGTVNICSGSDGLKQLQSAIASFPARCEAMETARQILADRATAVPYHVPAWVRHDNEKATRPPSPPYQKGNQCAKF